MKIKAEHLQKLTDMILLTALQAETVQRGQIRAFFNGLQTKDPVKRLMWDLLRGYGGMRFVYDELYTYLNDSHIDTALRSIFKKEIQPRYID